MWARRGLWCAALGVVLAFQPASAAPAFAAAQVNVANEGPGGRVTTGETVTYRVSVWNSGPDAAGDVSVDTVVDLLADADGVAQGSSSATSTQGSCRITRLTVACRLGPLEVGQVETITVRSVALSTGPVDSVAKVESEQCPADPCDVDAVPLVIRERKLDVTNALSPVIAAGDLARYTVRVRNPSPAVVRHLTLCDVLAPAFVIVDASPGGEFVYGDYCWSVRRLAAGAARRFGVTVRAPFDKTGRATMRAIVTSLDAKDADAKQTARVIPSG